MTTVTLLLLIAAAVCFLLAALDYSLRGRGWFISFGWLGLFAWAVLSVINGFRALP